MIYIFCIAIFLLGAFELFLPIPICFLGIVTVLSSFVFTPIFCKKLSEIKPIKLFVVRVIVFVSLLAIFIVLFLGLSYYGYKESLLEGEKIILTPKNLSK